MKKLLRPDGRLSLCAGMTRMGSRLADIGTDHGYLPIELCLSGRIPCALACDINPQPLSSARENIARYGLADRIHTRLSDGLKNVAPDEADDIVIAGMGGELIRDILSAAPWVRDGSKLLILQPMTRHAELVKWLYENGFEILRQEAAFDEGKYYTALAAVYSGKVRECDLLTSVIGALDTENELSRGFLGRALNDLNNRCKGDPSLLPAAEKLADIICPAKRRDICGSQKSGGDPR